MKIGCLIGHDVCNIHGEEIPADIFIVEDDNGTLNVHAFHHRNGGHNEIMEDFDDNETQSWIDEVQLIDCNPEPLDINFNTVYPANANVLRGTYGNIPVPRPNYMENDDNMRTERDELEEQLFQAVLKKALIEFNSR